MICHGVLGLRSLLLGEVGFSLSYTRRIPEPDLATAAFLSPARSVSRQSVMCHGLVVSRDGEKRFEFANPVSGKRYRQQ